MNKEQRVPSEITDQHDRPILALLVLVSQSPMGSASPNHSRSLLPRALT